MNATYMPTAEEIAAGCAHEQEHWTEAERQRRSGGCEYTAVKAADEREVESGLAVDGDGANWPPGDDRRRWRKPRRDDE